MASWELPPGAQSRLPSRRQVGELETEARERQLQSGGAAEAPQFGGLGRGLPPPLWVTPPSTSSATTPGAPVGNGVPGGAIAPGLRAPFGPVSSVAERQRPPIFYITHFDPAWGTPPDRSGEGLRWNPFRFVYEPSPQKLLAGESSAKSYYRQLAQSSVYVQAFREDGQPGSAWQSRFVRVPTLLPDASHPYEVTGKVLEKTQDVHQPSAPLEYPGTPGAGAAVPTWQNASRW